MNPFGNHGLKKDHTTITFTEWLNDSDVMLVRSFDATLKTGYEEETIPKPEARDLWHDLRNHGYEEVEIVPVWARKQCIPCKPVKRQFPTILPLS